MLPTTALIVFAKHPTPGRVKTRLTPPLTSAEAAELYRCMLLDTLDKVRSIAGLQGFLFYQDEPEAGPFFRSVAPDFVVAPQEGDDLGARMAAAFRRVFALGHRRAVIIGTDSPDLPLDYLRQAFQQLADDSVDALFGPSTDGGYYLLALKREHPSLFDGIPWSTGSVLETSLARAGESGLRVGLLPVWHDVDTAADLERDELLLPANGASLTRAFVARHPLVDS